MLMPLLKELSQFNYGSGAINIWALTGLSESF